MADDDASRTSREEQAIRQLLIELHGSLLKLHKALLDSEKILYEKNVGPIQSPNHFFQLLTSDPYFAWLRPVSQLIVVIDETLDGKQPLSHLDVDAIMNRAVFLLVPAKMGGEFGDRYVAALQRDPRVVLSHAQVAKRIGSRQPQD